MADERQGDSAAMACHPWRLWAGATHGPAFGGFFAVMAPTPRTAGSRRAEVWSSGSSIPTPAGVGSVIPATVGTGASSATLHFLATERQIDDPQPFGFGIYDLLPTCAAPLAAGWTLLSPGTRKQAEPAEC